MKKWMFYVFLLLVLVSSAASAATKYVVVNLGNLGSPFTFASAINNFGQITGGSYTSASTQHAFLWENGSMKDIDTFGSPNSAGLDINNSGQVVGLFTTSADTDHAFIYEGGKMTDLGTLSGGTISRAYSINDFGWVAGDSMVSTDTRYHVFLRKPRSAMVDLGTPDAGNAGPLSINRSGVIVRTSWIDLSNHYGWRWSQATGFTVPEIADSTDVILFDIDDNGIETGSAKLTSDGRWHPFVRTEEAGTLYLGVSNSAAYPQQINSNAAVVGTAENAGGNTYAFLWTPTEGVQNLQNLISGTSGWVLDSGIAINDKGWIVTQGYKSGAEPVGFTALLLVPADAPYNVNLSPESTTVAVGAKKTFTAEYSDPNFYTDIAFAYLLINPTLTGLNSIYMKYDQTTNKLYVRNDTDTAWLGGFAPGTNNTIQNSRVTLYCADTSVSGFGNDLLVRWAISIKSPLAGKTCGAWITVIDRENLRDSWDRVGTVKVGS